MGGEAENFTIEFQGKSYPAKQVVADVRSGMAMLKVDLATPALPIGKSEQLEIATPVVTIGYPLDLPETPSFGMIAGFDRKYLGRYFSTTHLRVNLPTQRGEAGAPLLNLKGEVVGILVSSLENNSACYALPIDAAEKKFAAISCVSAKCVTAGSAPMSRKRKRRRKVRALRSRTF